MTILIVDHNEQDLQSLTDILSSLAPEAVLLPYRSSLEALLAARSQEIDLAFLETALPELDGMDMGQYLLTQNVLFRWAVMLGLALLILVFGEYGVDFDSNKFIYFDF